MRGCALVVEADSELEGERLDDGERALPDTRNGYIYALDEASEKDTQLANAWTSDDAVDECRKRTEQRAIDKLVGQFCGTCAVVVRRYGSAGGDKERGRDTGNRDARVDRCSVNAGRLRRSLLATDH